MSDEHKPPTYAVDNTGRADGLIYEHQTENGRKAICGVVLYMTQPPCGNTPCRRCERIAKARAR